MQGLEGRSAWKEWKVSEYPCCEASLSERSDWTQQMKLRENFNRLLSVTTDPSSTDTALFLSRLSANSINTTLAPCPALDVEGPGFKRFQAVSPDFLPRNEETLELSLFKQEEDVTRGSTPANEPAPRNLKRQRFGGYDENNPYAVQAGLATLAAAGARAQAIDSLLDTIRASGYQSQDEGKSRAAIRKRARRRLNMFQESSLFRAPQVGIGRRRVR